MQLTITGRNLEVTAALRSYAAEKLGKLEKFLDAITAAHVMLSVEKYRQIVEVTLRVRDLTVRAEESTPDMYASLDLVVDKIERQICRYKERIIRHWARGGDRLAGGGERSTGGGGLRRGAGAALAEEPQEEAAPRVVKVKRFALKPATVDEAILQMDLLGHTFFVFRNALSGQVNVLYRRRDGQYGLIEPEG
ncbi:MAG TPA: ribosome-associated translation inhibitor RaiA [Candidatus Methylomirabilis sp.]|nr:ribosome-associated translation inhibitor RaiA [Candidatus Methylomirabilis sp.]